MVVDSPSPSGKVLSTASTALLRQEGHCRQRRQSFSARKSVVDSDDSPFPAGEALSTPTTVLFRRESGCRREKTETSKKEYDKKQGTKR